MISDTYYILAGSQAFSQLNVYEKAVITPPAHPWCSLSVESGKNPCEGKRKGSGVISKHLFVLLACLFVVMIGLGITMPVLPFYVERLALAEGAIAPVGGDARRLVDRRVRAGAAHLRARVGALVRSNRKKTAHLNRHCGLRRRAGSFRSGHIAVAALRGAHSRRHFVLGNTAGLGSLRCRHDD